MSYCCWHSVWRIVLGCVFLSGVAAPAFALDSGEMPKELSDTELLDVAGLAQDGHSLSELEQDALCLSRVYPTVVRGLKKEAEGIWLILQDGKRVLYADASPVRYTRDGVPENATVQQSMAEPYPRKPAHAVPPQGVNPGRTRSMPLLEALYSSNPQQQDLVTVQVGSEQIQITARHDMEAAFRRVAAGLAQLATDPAVGAYIFPLGGGYYHRVISGTTRLSPHSYGIAVDLNPARGGYWRWKHSHPDYAGYPQSVVELFESNGFIWGGKWHNFDLMHFEYRPEILCKARLKLEQTQAPKTPQQPKPTAR